MVFSRIINKRLFENVHHMHRVQCSLPIDESEGLIVVSIWFPVGVEEQLIVSLGKKHQYVDPFYSLLSS